jgi:hypothetical protein
MEHLKRKLILTRKGQNYQLEKSSEETAQKKNSLEIRGESHQSSDGVTCARPLKKSNQS